MTWQEELNDALLKISEYIDKNAVPLIILGSLCFIFFFIFAKYLWNRRNESLRAMHEEWKGIKKTGNYLTDRITLYISSLDGSFLELKGKCYRIKSEKFYEDFYQIKMESRTKKIAELSADDYEPVQIPRKTETYAFLDKTNRTVAAVQLTNLKPHQSLLSEVGFMLLSRIDPRRNNFLFYMIIGCEMVLIFLLIWAIQEDKKLDFLIEAEMWGWYALIIFAAGFQVWLMKSLWGHFAVVWEVHTNKEEVELFTPKGKRFSLTIPVALVKPYWFRGCPIDGILKLDNTTLAQEINDANAQKITSQSSEIQTLKSQIQILNTLVDEKAIELSSAYQRLMEERALGYIEGRQDSHADLHKQTTTGLDLAGLAPLMQKTVPIAIIGVLLIFAIKILGDMVELTEMQMTIALVAGVGFMLIILLLAAARAFEATRRPVVG